MIGKINFALGAATFSEDYRSERELHGFLHGFGHAAGGEHGGMRKFRMNAGAWRIHKRKWPQRTIIALSVFQDSEDGEHGHRAREGVGAVHVARALRVAAAKIESDFAGIGRDVHSDGEWAIAGDIIIERLFTGIFPRGNRANLRAHGLLGRGEICIDVSVDALDSVAADQLAHAALADIYAADLAENVSAHNVRQLDLAQ